MSECLADNVDQLSPPSPAAGVGEWFSVTITIAVIVVLGATLLTLDRTGKSSRSTPAQPAVVVVDDSEQLLEIWESGDLHGVALVDATRDTKFEMVPMSTIAAPTSWPVSPLDLPGLFRDSVSRRNVVWVGSKTGIVRSVDYVIPAVDFEEKVRAGREAGQPGIAADGLSVTANDEGYLRYLRTSFPVDPGTSKVLNVDASYFVNGTPEGLAGLLQASAADYGLITVNRAEDATDVPEAARLKADQMAEILRAQVSR